jgi:hypothetical protein
MIAGLICGLFWFCAFLAGQLTVQRLCAALARPRATNQVLLGCLAGLAISVFLVCHLLPSAPLTRGGALIGLLWGVLTLACLFVLYMPFYYTVASSLSVRTLVMLASQHSGSMPIVDVRERFVSRALIGYRLEVMCANGFLKQTDRENFALTIKGKRLARTFGGLKRFWRMDAGG